MEIVNNVSFLGKQLETMDPQWPQNLVAVGDTTHCTNCPVFFCSHRQQFPKQPPPFPYLLHPILFLLQDLQGSHRARVYPKERKVLSTCLRTGIKAPGNLQASSQVVIDIFPDTVSDCILPGKNAVGAEPSNHQGGRKMALGMKAEALR